MKIWSIIPARAGSKGIPGKNIADLGGWPLIAYSVIASKMTKQIQRTIVSTDSEEIGLIAENYGAEFPFIRPGEFATDGATDLGWVLHALDWFQKEEGEVPDYLVHLRPTTPLRDADVISSAIMDFCDPSSSNFTSLRSVHELAESPYKMFQEQGDRCLIPYINTGSKVNILEGLDLANQPRQNFPTALVPNGYVDILDVKYILETRKLHGDRIMSFVTNKVVEIDTPQDRDEADLYVKKSNLYSKLELLF